MYIYRFLCTRTHTLTYIYIHIYIDFFSYICHYALVCWKGCTKTRQEVMLPHLPGLTSASASLGTRKLDTHQACAWQRGLMWNTCCRLHVAWHDRSLVPTSCTNPHLHLDKSLISLSLIPLSLISLTLTWCVSEHAVPTRTPRLSDEAICLIKDGHLPSERGKETWDFQRICTGFVVPRDQRLGAPKAHRMMGKTQWRHCKRSFGTNVLVLGKQRNDFPLLSEPLKTDVNKNVVIERFLN